MYLSAGRGQTLPNVKRNQLSTLQVRNAKPGAYTDGGGLTLRVKPSGGKSWVLRVTVDGKRRNIGLGAYPGVSLKAAREQADDLRKAASRGEDLTNRLEAQRTVRHDAPGVPTFSDAAERVIALRAPTWSSARHATQWQESLRLHALPVLGDRPVDEIETADVLAILEPIWTSKAETASRVRQRMATIFDYCVAAGWVDLNPCNGAVKAALPRRARQRRHHPALPYAEVADALDAMRETPGHETTRLAMEFLILTAARAGEVRHATWDMIDMESAVWTVPAEYMKMRRPHRVPLSRQALAVLRAAGKLTDGTGLLFPSNRKKGRPFSNMAFAMLLRRAGYGHVTTHGFRASFRTWTLEQTDAPWAVAETALAHNLGGGEVMAYARSDLFQRRRELMEQWGSFIAGGHQ